VSVFRRQINAQRKLFVATGFALSCLAGARIAAQQPTDTSVQSSPVAAPPKVPAVDSSVQASPVPGPAVKAVTTYVAPGTAIPVRLTEAIESGTLKNGTVVHATLAVPVKLSAAAQAAGTGSGSPSLPAGSAVELSVIETVPADKIDSAGEMSLQLVRVGTMSVFTDTQTFNGKPGHKELPDSSPAKGTEATLAAGATLTFHVQPPPTAATGPAKPDRQSPGPSAPPQQ
jgi:hypothetical protein